MKYRCLFTPAKIGTLNIKNRCIMAPMSTALSNPDGTVTDALIAYFDQRARGGVGLILTEYAFVSESGRSSDHQISVADDSKIPGLKKLADAMHADGVPIGLQLQHGGRRSMIRLVSSSPIAMSKDQDTPYALTTEEVYSLEKDFVVAAVRAQKSGYDLVEIHCAHGYLLNDFVSPHTNRRTDEFGGGTTGRAKIVTDIIKEIKRVCGKEYPVSVRMSAEEMVEDGDKKRDSACMAQLFEDAGADLINVSCGINGVGYGIAPAARETGHNADAAEEISRVVDIAVAVAGRINEPEYAEAILRAGKARFVTIGRALFADPEFMNKAEDGRETEIAPCIGCLQRCYGHYGHGDGTFRSCTVNPFAMRETKLVIKPAVSAKKIVVVGAGPAGLEASWIAAKRGHNVIMYEKNDYIGGQFATAAVPPHKQLLARAISYYRIMCEKYGVKIHYNTEATKKLILSDNPDTVILATGGTPIVPRIPGIDDANVMYGQQILHGTKVRGNRVLIIGGGAQGAETADYLSEYGYSVTIIEMRDGIALDDPEATRNLLLERFVKYNVKSMVGTTVKRIYKDGADYENNGTSGSERGYDQIVLAIGVKSYNPLAEQLKGSVKELITLGDAEKARDGVDAIYKGAVTGVNI